MEILFGQKYMKNNLQLKMRLQFKNKKEATREEKKRENVFA